MARYSAGIITTIYVDADSFAEAERLFAEALSDMEEAAAKRNVEFEHELDAMEEE